MLGGAGAPAYKGDPRDQGLAPIRGQALACQYRGTSLIRNNPSLGPYRRLMPRALWWS